MAYQMLFGTGDIKNVDLWLGGTTDHGPNAKENDWRRKLIPLLNPSISYYDPFLREWETDEEWDETAMKNEELAKKYARIHVYTFTPEMQGVFAIAEVTERAVKNAFINRNPTVICILDRDKMDESMKRSLLACCKLWMKHGAIIVDNLESCANKVNAFYRPKR